MYRLGWIGLLVAFNPFPQQLSAAHGVYAQQLIGQRMTVWAESGPIAAVIARKAIHLLTDEECCAGGLDADRHPCRRCAVCQRWINPRQQREQQTCLARVPS